MEDRLLKRNEVPVNQTWDLSLIYKNDAEMEADVNRIKELVQKIADFKGRLTTAENIVECLKLYEQELILGDYVNNYVGLAFETDHTDVELHEKNDRISNLFCEFSTALSFLDSEIAEADEKELERAKEIYPPYARYISQILKEKAHMLSKDTEKALSALSQSIYSGYDSYLSAKHADMKFEDFVVDGKSYALGYSLFEDDYEYDSRTDVRRAAFEAFHKKLRQYENVTASAYNQCVRTEKTMSDLRGYKDVFDYLLSRDNVPRALYDRQIDVIMKKLAPHMRKYAKLLQKIHKLDKMTYADLKLTVDSGYSPEVTMEEAKKYCTEGLSILGPDYVKMVEEAFDKRWFDVANNEGKCTGGFCSSPYRKNSFILLSFNGRMSDVFTMAHELGHAGHFKAASNANSFYDTFWTLPGYYTESPSTMNELLLAHHLLKTNNDKRFRRWVLSNMVSNTYYHNFVTHLLEAAYQREVYKIMEDGGAVNAGVLSDIFKTVLSEFWGDTVELTEGAELTWMRQPHYYMGLYSYTYSAGLTIATAACDRIEKEGASAVEDWKRGLAAGGRFDAIQFAKNAGVDITTEEPLNRTIEIIGEYIDEICQLTEELEK